jgi:hypothetical protein
VAVCSRAAGWSSRNWPTWAWPTRWSAGPGPALQAFYTERWSVEQLPLAAQQVVGAHRQFVFAEERRQRLPEWAFLAGSLRMDVAATAPALRTGFWERVVRPTCGPLRRLLARVPFLDVEGLPAHFRKEASVTNHPPKGVQGHRRQPLLLRRPRDASRAPCPA